MRLYAITDSGQLPQNAQAAENILISLASQWAEGGVEVIQLREREMTACALESLARRILAAVRDAPVGRAATKLTRVLINGRVDVAIAAQADGVHLPTKGALTPPEVRRIYAKCGRHPPIISVACHSIADIDRARESGATMAVFAPVFGKVQRQGSDVSQEGNEKQHGSRELVPGVGLAALAAACQAAGSMPVFALGGITAQNATACLEAGAAGVAGIRLFQSQEWRSLPSSV